MPFRFIRFKAVVPIPELTVALCALMVPVVTLVISIQVYSFDPALEEAAFDLGATRWQVLREVTLPVLFPGLFSGALFAFLLSWSQYLSTLIIGGGQITTLPILLFALMGSGDRPVAAAVGLVFVLPSLAALVVSARHLGGRSMAGVW